jgi:hypothetical protein
VSTPTATPSPKITERRAHDGKSAADMLGTLGEGQVLLGDSAYDGDALHRSTAERGAWANIKLMPGRSTSPPSVLSIAASEISSSVSSTAQTFQSHRYAPSKSMYAHLAPIKLADTGHVGGLPVALAHDCFSTVL